MTTLAQEFNAKWRPIITPIAQKYGINPDFALTQIAQESWWGTKTPAGSNNYAGIQDFRKNSVGSMARDDGKIRKFRRFANEQEFAEHYLNLLSRLYPGTVGAKTIEEFGIALQDGARRYAGSPKYKQHLAEVYNQNYANGSSVATNTTTTPTTHMASTSTAVSATPTTGFSGGLPIQSKQKPVTKDPYEDLWGVKLPKENDDWMSPKLTSGLQSPYRPGTYKFDWGV